MLNDRIVYRYGYFRLCLKISNSMHGPKKTIRLRLAVGCLTYKRWESNARILGSKKNFCLIHRLFWKMETIALACINHELFFDSLYSYINQKTRSSSYFYEIHTESNDDFKWKNQWNGLFLSTWLIRCSVSALQNGLLHNIYLNSKIRTDKFRKFCQSFL